MTDVAIVLVTKNLFVNLEKSGLGFKEVCRSSVKDNVIKPLFREAPYIYSYRFCKNGLTWHYKNRKSHIFMISRLSHMHPLLLTSVTVLFVQSPQQSFNVFFDTLDPHWTWQRKSTQIRPPFNTTCQLQFARFTNKSWVRSVSAACMYKCMHTRTHAYMHREWAQILANPKWFIFGWNTKIRDD